MDKRPEIETYFCVLCPDVFQVMCFESKIELENHLRDTHLKNSSEDESTAINLWIERHIKYQESLYKSMAQTIKTVPDRNKTIYKGCPVCDRIIQVFNIRSDPFSKGAETHELLIRDINLDYSGNNVNHINPHLKYYPYECLICKDECEKSRQRGDPDIKEVVKTSVKAMMRRHIIDKHLKNTSLVREELEQEIEKSILTLKIMVLELITRKEVQPTKHSIRKRKIKSIPGPLRSSEKPEPLKKFPILIQPNQITHQNKYLIPLATVIPHMSVLSPSPSTPLMTSTPVSKIQITTQTNFESKTVNKLEEVSSSEEELTDNDFDLMKDKSEVFGCIFCFKRFQTYEKVFDHYLLHCNVFIECAKCDQKFKSIADFRSHNSLHNENCNLLNVSEYKTVRKWIEKFLDYLQNDRQTLLSLTYGSLHCSVCLMVSYVYNFESTTVLPENQKIENHIHNHMNYFPFECIDCNYEEIKTEFILDSKATRHLHDKHDIKNAEAMTPRELSTYFIENSSIKRLDELIEQSTEIIEEINKFSSITSEVESMGLEK